MPDAAKRLATAMHFCMQNSVRLEHLYTAMSCIYVILHASVQLFLALSRRRRAAVSNGNSRILLIISMKNWAKTAAPCMRAIS